MSVVGTILMAVGGIAFVAFLAGVAVWVWYMLIREWREDK